MNGYYINIHVRSKTPVQIREAAAALFLEHGFQPVGDESALAVVEDEDKLPAGEDWYGVLISGDTREGWSSVYVEDWQDSGVLAKGLSAVLETPALEVWVAEDVHWGYTYYESGAVRDRFADAPVQVAGTPEEAAALNGQPEVLLPILRTTAPEFRRVLQDAQANAGEFVGPAIDSLTQAVGLPFDHVLIGYESFFEDNPEDYEEGLEAWPEWRHLAFRHPHGRETLAD